MTIATLSYRGMMRTPGRTPSHWVLISREQTALARMQGQTGWAALSDRGRASPWTDDYSNIFESLMLGRSAR